jgi:hypothetical protein
MKSMPAAKAILVVSAFLFSATAFAQPKSPHETMKGKNVSVTYGRPYKRGRNIFGGLEPYGQVYRLGADSATTITFDKNVVFAGKPVNAGTYTMFVIPNEKTWTIILNGQLHQFGAFSYEKYKDKDILHADVPVIPLSTPVEQLTIEQKGDKLVISWDVVKVEVSMVFH